jgi:hypothetical protein
MIKLLLSLLLLPSTLMAQGPTRYHPGDAESLTTSALKSFSNSGLQTGARQDAMIYVAERMAYGTAPLAAETKAVASKAAAEFLTTEAHRFTHVSLWEMRYAAVAIVDRTDGNDALSVLALEYASDQSREAVVAVRIRAVQALTRRGASNVAALDVLKELVDVKNEPAADVRRWAINGLASAAQQNAEIAADDGALRVVLGVLEDDPSLGRWAAAALGSFDLAQASGETQARLRGLLAGRPALFSHQALVQQAVVDALKAHPISDAATVEALRAKLHPKAGNWALRGSAAEALGRVGALGQADFDKETVTALSNAMLSDKQAFVRGRAATSLACFGAAGRCADFALKSAFDREWDRGVRQRIDTTRRRLAGIPEEAPIVIPGPARAPVHFDAPINNGVIRR